MSNFDINSNFNPQLKYSREMLCKEIITDFHNNSSYKIKDIYRRLKNSSKNGIIDRLKKHINYDIEKNAENNPQCNFEMLQLLKLLYAVEFLGFFPNSYINSNRNTIPIINILKKPSLENIYTIFSTNSTYGAYTSELIEIITKKVDPQHNRIKSIQKINNIWHNFIKDITFRYSCDDEPLKNPEKYLDMMKSFNYFLENNIIPTLELSKNNIQYKEGVLISFLNIVLLHYYECYDNDILLLLDFEIYENINIEYINEFKELEYNVFNIKIIDELICHIKNDTDDDFLAAIVHLINYNSTKYDKTKLLYALDKSKAILRLIELDKKADFTNGIDITLLITVIQEILYVCKEKPQIKMSELDSSIRFKSLKTFLSKYDNGKHYKKQQVRSEPAVINLAWVERVSNRLLFNFGLYENLKEAQKTKKLIYQIKNDVYSLVNYEDIGYVTQQVTAVLARWLNFYPYKSNNELLTQSLKNKLNTFLKNSC